MLFPFTLMYLSKMLSILVLISFINMRHETMTIEGVDKNTFKILAELASCDVIINTHDGYYK